MTDLYLVRHGETDWNRQRRIQGLTDIPLNEVGREQARSTGRLLARRAFDGVFASPLLRAMETAHLIANEIRLGAPVPIPELVERNYGDAEGLDFEEVERRFPGRIAIPGQESRGAVIGRVIPALRDLAIRHPGTSLVVVSHGGAIRAVLTEVAPESSHGAITNGSVHSFSVREDAVRLIAFNDPIDVESIREGDDDINDQNAIEAREGAA